jgi:hypothetical protein
VNTAIVDMVHEVERTGAFLTPSDVVGRVGRSAGRNARRNASRNVRGA